MPVFAKPRPVRILGTGVVRPDRRVESAEIDARLGLPAGTVQRRSGARAIRGDAAHRIGPAAEAARQAICSARLTLSDIDCVVAASASMDQAMPYNAALIHRELGLGSSGIPAFDIGASCLGFSRPSTRCRGDRRRSLPARADRRGRHRQLRARLERPGCVGDLGDGAAAAVLGLGDESSSCLLASGFATYSEGAHFCEIPGCGSRHPPSRANGDYAALSVFRMDGPAVYQLVAKHIDGFVSDLLERAGVDRRDLTLLVPHQASHLGLRHITGSAFERERVVDIYAEHGNGRSVAADRARRGDLHDAAETGRYPPCCLAAAPVSASAASCCAIDDDGVRCRTALARSGPLPASGVDHDAGRRLERLQVSVVVRADHAPADRPDPYDTGYAERFDEATSPVPERFYRWLTPVTLPPHQHLLAQLRSAG